MIISKSTISWSLTGATVFKERSFSDVTLVSDDQKPFQAHKYVLSACSPVFKTLLLDSQHKHPVIFLRGVGQQELALILQFVYLGQIQVDSEEINSVIVAAKNLEIKQLFKPLLVQKETSANIQTQFKNKIPGDFINSFEQYESSNFSSPIEEPFKDKNNFEANQIVETSQPSINFTLEKGQTVQGYNDKAPKTNSTFALEETSEDSLVRYCCDLCEYRATRLVHLKTHQKTVHSVINYFCNKCDHLARDKPSLWIHQQVEHDEVLFDCDECEYKTTNRACLRTHKKSQHGGIHYFCNFCDFKTKWSSNLLSHKKVKHSSF